MILTSVIKIEPDQVTLENDTNGETYVIPKERFPEIAQGIQMGQIFNVDLEVGTILFDEEETVSRKARVASLLARLHKI